MRLFAILLPFLFIGCTTVGQVDDTPTIKDLHEGWTFAEEGQQKWLEATVPGVIHTDLLKHGLIPDPWYGLNEKDIQWVEEKNWVYKRSFDVTEEELQNGSCELVFEGLDTYAKVYLNNNLVDSTYNMHRTWVFEVKEHLKLGKNELRIVFESPVNKWREHVKNAPIELPASSEMVEIKVSPYVRKAPYHFGWDWGPRYVTSGIWRPVYLKFTNQALIKDVQVHQKELSDSLAIIDVEAQIHTSEQADYTLFIGIKKVELVNFKGDTTVTASLRIENPKKWWPNGWGDQPMYNVSAILKKENIVCDRKSRQIGLRTVELVQKEDDLGRSFFFKVNGHKFFVRGVNYIPQSNFLPSVRKSQYDSLINDAKEVNINMIRVWGGGIYEDDYFYELCDQNGIMVWQDFMFAGTMYPGDSAFMQNVAAEVEQNVTRLRNHPSIAHWNGNNEIEVAWHQWGWHKKYNYSKADSTFLYHNYLALFDTLIPSILSKVDPNRSYTPTSPERSYTKLREIKSGTVHYWGVWHAAHEFDKYRQYLGRFMAEWGFQSFPNMETIRSFSSENDWALDSEVMKWHQKSPVGNGMIEKQGLKYFDKPADFAEFVKFSQLTQALAMRVAIDAHRLAEYNGGTMYWQLNDCWPGPSWSTRDVYGRWKESHKQLKWIYAPVAVLPKLENDVLLFISLNDLIETRNVTLEINEVKVQKDKAKPLHSKRIVIAPSTYNTVWKIDDKKTLKKLKKGEIHIEVVLTDNNGTIIFNRIIDQYDILTY